MRSVMVNGESRPLVETLATLVKELDLEDAAIATAVNGQFVPATERAITSLSAGDDVEILAPMQGG